MPPATMSRIRIDVDCTEFDRTFTVGQIVDDLGELEAAALARALAARLPRARLGVASMSDELKTTDDFGRAFAPEIAAFLRDLSVLT